MNRPKDTPQAGDLAAALGELANLMIATPHLDALLDDLARLAAGILTPLGSCGITLRHEHAPMTVANSDSLAAQLDEVQYGQDDGPCLETLRTGQVTLVTDTATELRWGQYPAHALGYGVRSSLSLPLAVNGDTHGALNLYATSTDAFGTEQQARANIFAAQASLALTLAHRQAQQTQLTDQLREALATRAVIDQALGILMAQQACDSDTAFTILRTTSQNQNRKLRHVAAAIIQATTGGTPRPPTFTDPS
jgi:GAF domain-containing protein